MADVHVLRLRRTDTPASAPPSYILLHVQKSGSQPLDAKLIATEREHLYLSLIHISEPTRPY